MYNLLAKAPVFAEMPIHGAVLPIVEKLLDRGCLLSGMTAIDIGPGEDAQPMHGDDIVMSRHLQRPYAPMMVTSMWALTDFTAENGGTRFVPGSHRFNYDIDGKPVPPDVEVRALEMPAGAVTAVGRISVVRHRGTPFPRTARRRQPRRGCARRRDP